MTLQTKSLSSKPRFFRRIKKKHLRVRSAGKKIFFSLTPKSLLKELIIINKKMTTALPLKNQSAYLHYCSEVRASIQQNNPGIKSVDIVKKIILHGFIFSRFQTIRQLFTESVNIVPFVPNLHTALRPTKYAIARP